MNYSSLALQIFLLQCIQEVQYIALQYEMEDQIEAFPGIWNAKTQFILDSMRKTPKLLSLCAFPDVHGYWLKSYMYMRVLV